jgi:tRNA A-37 threonylcarbamoyl transferase component Bud32
VIELLARLQAALGDAFVVEQELGGGGMSRLFLAMEVSLNRRVVIKLLPPEMSSEMSAARFKQEMEFAARLQHPHILPILAAAAREGLLFYIMPFVAGESLRARLSRDGRLPVGEAVRLLAEITDALAFAHGQGIIHRDIKPENILLEGKHAVLADFGIARAVLESRTGNRLTATGVSVGTPGYMSPEQLSGDPVDARADLYALAVVGYEMLTGETPFRGPSAQAVITAHLTTPPIPVSELRPEVPAPVSDAIGRALAKAPGDRFDTAAEFADALGAHHAARVEPRPSRRVKGRRVALAALALLALGLVGALLARASQQRARDQALLARLRPAADSGHLDEVAAALASAGADPGESRFATLASHVVGLLGIESEPAGAQVSIVRVTPVATFLEHPRQSLGPTPLQPRPVVAGEYLVQLSAPRNAQTDLHVTVRVGDTLRLHRVLLPLDGASAGMVAIDGGPTKMGNPVQPFLISRREVTNAEYLRFVAAGGYRDPALWPAQMIIAGKNLPRADALARLVDRAGTPGPRSWINGRHPDGQDQHPVVGVSWYEAAAYARWSGGELPTLAQWWRAALGDTPGPFPWGTDGASIEARANFGLAGTRPVGSLPLGMSPFGVEDLAGNVREWLRDIPSASDRRIAAGGSWQDPSYMFETSHTEVFDPAHASDNLGFRIVKAPGDASRTP